MKKVFDQTVRDLKREVNKKVLKVPGIEQMVLDATSNEPWGPHGSHLADIAQATRNYNEYTLIMSVLWKRINDTGKNWRHVYKALTVLEYLVGHGSERVIDEIREHAYQISTLSDFQYIDSGGRDQGSNVRKKSQALVSLVNDKERIQEVRQKAIANRDKFRGPSSTGGMYRPSSYSSPGGGYGDRYDDDRYGNRDDDRNGYGREREWGYRDDDRYGRGGDSYGRGGDRYGRDSDERYSRDGYRDDDYRGRHSTDDYQYGSRSRSSEREKDRPYEDDDHHSSRSGGGRADDRSPEERRLERKPSEPNVGAPPSYEEVTASAQNHTTTDERDGRTVATAPKASSPPPGSIGKVQSTTGAAVASPSTIKEVNSFDEFDPRASAPTPPPVVVASSADADLFGIFSDSVPQNELALVPVSPGTTTFEPNASANSSLGTTFVPLSSASTVLNQPSENPFEDAPFKAIPSEDSFVAQQQSFVPQLQGFMPQQQNAVPQQQSFAPQQQGFAPQQQGVVPQQQGLAPQQQGFAPQQQGFAPQQQGVVPQQQGLARQQQGFAPQQQGFAPQQQGVVPQQQGFVPQQQSYTPQQSFVPQQQSYTPQQQSFAPQQQSLAPQQQSFGPQQQSSAQTQSFMPVASFQQPTAVPESSGPHQAQPQGLGYSASFQQPSVIPESTGPLQLKVEPVSNFEFADTFQGITYTPTGVTNVSSALEFSPQVLPPPVQPSSDIHLQSGPAGAPVASQAAWAPQTVPPAKAQPSKDKFEPKSTVWADTLSRGLVNLNISGPKINPLADIGIDFDSINRMEKRKEKSSGTPAVSTVTMGKAMGTGSGIGRAGVSGLAPPPNPMMGNGMGMGGGAGMAMGGYGAGMNRPIGMMGGMNQPMGMGMGLNMGMGQGLQMQPGVPGGYNPMMGMGGYTQQPYGGYR